MPRAGTVPTDAIGPSPSRGHDRRGGIALAYDSYGWTGGHGWPVSFCVVALIFGGYLLASRTPPRGAGRRAKAA